AGLLGRDNAQIERLCASISVEDNFFDLGGHSLMAVNLIAKIQKELGTKISLAELFKNPTIRKIAESIRKQDINGREQEEYAVIDLVEKKEYYPLSAIQRGLFLQQQLDRENITYNISQFYPVKGKLAADRISAIFQAIIQRHESLRTSFRVINGQPVQIIHDQVAFKLAYYEIKPGIETLQAGIMQEFIRPFDLEGPSQFRAGLIQYETTSILMIDTHHIIFDGRSGQILMAEFTQLYYGRELVPLALQYKDFAAWQNRLGESEEMAKQERYWLKQFENGIPGLNLPLDYERPQVQSFEGSSMDFAIDPVETQALARLAKEEKLTMNMVLLAVVHIWLSKICSQETAIIGISVEGRKHADLQHIIGMFVNTLVIISQPGPEKTLKDYFLEMKEKTLAALDNQDYQYEELVRKVVKKRDPGRNPLVDLVFAFNAPTSSLENNEEVEKENAANAAETANEEPGMNLESLSEEKKRAKFDINLLGSEMGGHLFFNLVYCTKLFKRETIEIFTGYFKKIVSFIIKEENRDCLLKDIILSHTLAESKDDFSRDDYVDFDF
ncbi:MAG: condensation domain-containing protein, partial [Acidobacteria bacterium]|nr:condensation domain-containing protein [Acidobacteriota bacterium]